MLTKKQKNADGRPANKKFMKMKELSQVTGVNSATIRYYINQGLLPRPHKTHRNMAYYDESYIDLINLIKKLQKEYFLPLEMIKKGITEVGHDKAPYMVNDIINKLVQEKGPALQESDRNIDYEKGLTKEELIEASGLAREDFEAAVAAEFLIEDENGLFDNENIQVAMLLAEIRSRLTPEKGFSTEFFITHFKTLEALVNKELSIFMKNIEDGKISEEDVNKYAYKSFNLFYKLTPLIHKRLINKKIKDALNL